MVNASRSVLIAGCAAAGLLAGGHAYAAAADGSAVEEVVVTAQKRTELLKDVPSSVTALTTRSFQDLGAVKLEDYVGRIPGLTVSNVSMAQGSTQITIRGVTTGIGGNPTVGVYIDDSPFGGSGGFGSFTVPNLDPQDLARVEVLRGPQGTLYGAGSLGGLLKYVTAEPDPSHFFGRMQVDGQTVDGGGQGYAVRVAVNLPINDKLALRVSGYDRDDPGYVDNVLTGEENVNDFRVYGGRASLLWHVNDDWKVRLSALYNYQKGAGPLVQYNPFTFQPAYSDLKNAFAIGSNVNEQKLGAYNLEIEGALGDFAIITSSTGYDRQRMVLRVDYTELVGPLVNAFFGIPGVGASINDNPVGVDKFVQEVRLASPADAKLAWLVGGFYTHEHTSVLADLTLFDAVSGAPVTGLPNFFTGDSDTRFEEIAGFGDLTYHFSPAFDVTGGLRYSRNNQHFVTVADGIINGGHTFADVKSDDSAVTWLINPRYHVNDATMVYARIATGYRPGAPNTGIAGTPLSYGPDKVTNYEVGLKTDLFDHRVSLEGSLYWIDWKDIQLQEVSPAGISYIANRGTAVSRGMDLQAEFRPAAGLQLYANVAYQDTYLTSDFPAGGQIGNKGDPLPLTPKWSGGLGGDYHFPLAGEWSGQVGADWRFVGKTYGAFANPGLPRFEHPSYDVLDLRAGVNNDRWTLMFYAKNVGDSRGQSADLGIGLTRVSIIQPRTYAVSLSTTF
jgi:outer membrane receptor protein involved in Fe transport